MLVHLINLDRSTDRLSEFQATNGHLENVRRFAAVDGNTLDTAALIAEGTIRGDVLAQNPDIPSDIPAKYTTGAIGNALSHIALWRQAIESDTAFTICEDDAIFNAHFDRAASEAIQALPPDWDLIMWGWNTNSPISFEAIPGAQWCVAYFVETDFAETASDFQRRALSPTPLRLREAFGLVCYSISVKGARALAEFCLPLRAMGVYSAGLKGYVPNCGLDVMLVANFAKLKAYVSFPPLVITKNEQRTSLVQA